MKLGSRKYTLREAELYWERNYPGLVDAIKTCQIPSRIEHPREARYRCVRRLKRAGWVQPSLSDATVESLESLPRGAQVWVRGFGPAEFVRVAYREGFTVVRVRYENKVHNHQVVEIAEVKQEDE